MGVWRYLRYDAYKPVFFFEDIRDFYEIKREIQYQKTSSEWKCSIGWMGEITAEKVKRECIKETGSRDRIKIFWQKMNTSRKGAPSLSLRKRNLKLKRKFRFAWKRKKSLISHDSLRCETPKIWSENEGKISEN
jgi:hypothetical protein